MSYDLIGMTHDHLNQGFLIQHRPITPMGTYPTIEPLVRWGWTPIIGPTAVVILRSMAEVPDGTYFELESLARCFGLGRSRAKNGVACRSIARLDQYVAGFTTSLGIMVVPNRVPLPNGRQRDRYWNEMTTKMVEAGTTARAIG